MNDDELRALVREAIQKHLGSGPRSADPGNLATPVTLGDSSMAFSRYKVQRVSDDGMCLIEPAVRCNHCGYCECHGH